jgi:lipopolysaccharide biosynthesis protein
MSQRLVDAKTLINDPTFDQEMFLGTSRSVETRDVTIARYLTIASARGWDTLPDLDHRFRRPAPGFNPRVYAAANASRLVGGVDPLADFVRRGRPVGTWQAAVLRPEDPDDEVTPIGRLKVALHAHFFYPELCSEFLFHLATNQTRCDLMISTDNSIKAGQLRRVLRSYTNGQVEIRVVPNRGRDLGPLLSEFAEDLADYDLIGHVHAKRSPYVGDPASDQDWGDTWREFLWQNLLGGLHPMMDRIVAAFEHREGLGLVFPSDPNLIGWGDNRVQAAEIARSMGWTGQLSDHFDFPLGTMFWMRLNALRPLVDLRLGWNDYSEEPLAYDGTLLHALERLPTIACQLAGFTYAVTHVRGVSWMPPT